MISIYLITNSVNGKRYVGQSIDPQYRLRSHRKLARAGAPGALYAAMRKYGATAFRFQVIESCESRDRANDLERRWIRVAGSRTGQHGYNQTAGGEGGADPDASTRAKIGHAAANRSPEARAKMSAPRSEEGKRLIAEAARRRSAALTPEDRERLAAAQRGKKASAETRAKISAAGKGKPKSIETRAKMSVAAKLPSPKRSAAVIARNIARVWTDEARARMAARVISKETRANMSAAQRLRHARERGDI